jgi:hypothetical protein
MIAIEERGGGRERKRERERERERGGINREEGRKGRETSGASLEMLRKAH